MKLYLSNTREELGVAAAGLIAQKLNAAIVKKGEARLLLSTGASQFETLGALVGADIDWSRVTMFHLDEYVALNETHIASFRKYLKERFLAYAPVKKAYLIDGCADTAATIAALTEAIGERPIDVGVIGIGENAHIAFNDPPADFETRESYRVVTLDERCKRQQVREGWFATSADVPNEAISMTPYRIMCCECIVSPVPGAVKADAIHAVLSSHGTDPMIPGTLLLEHADFNLFVDADSASKCGSELINSFK